MSVFKCRPAEECYWDDPYYSSDVIVPDYLAVGPFAERRAAEEFADNWCSERSEYSEMDVQVLTADGWVTFEVEVRSVPEFVAIKKKGVPPVPDTFRCNDCKRRLPKTELQPDSLTDTCVPCYAKWIADDGEGG